MKMRYSVIVLSLLGALLSGTPYVATTSAWAESPNGCLGAYNLNDRNCDGKTTIAFIGDSIVYGAGDTEFPNAKGYARRVKLELPDLDVLVFGYPGIKTDELQHKVRAAAQTKSGPLVELETADMIFIDAGRNDYKLDRNPKNTVSRLAKIAFFARSLSHSQDDSFAKVIVNPQIPTLRAGQETFVQGINQVLLGLKVKPFAIGPRLDELAPTILSHDLLHPNSAGYSLMGIVVSDYLIADK